MSLRLGLEWFGRNRAREEGNYTVGSYSLREEEFHFLANVVYVQNVCFFSCGPAGREDDETYGSHGHVAVSASDAHDVSFWTITR